MRTVTTVFISLFVMFGILALVFAGPYFNNLLSPDPPKPEIRYGEFPFRIEYEINGERLVIEDTVICEFDGISISAAGKRRMWKSHLASGSKGSGMILYVIDNKRKVTFNAGEPGYYMGEPGMSPIEYWHYALKAFLVERESTVGAGVLFPEQWYDEYNFRFISWEFTDPIVNTFN